MNTTSPGKLYHLARVVMPSIRHEQFKDLYVRTDRNKLHFDTWMNTFAAKKFYYYCELGETYFQIKAKGTYHLEIIGTKRPNDAPHEDVVIYSQEVSGDACVHVPNAAEYDGLFFSIFKNPHIEFEFISAAWCTDIAPQRQNKIAIVACTFKREDYIKQNVALFEDFLALSPELKDRFKLLVVDNGRSLPESIKSENVELYPNMNAGGAGGFTRGLIEVMQKDAGFTHVLFMDDDVEINTESFFRTLTISDYLKETFKDSFIDGCMMDMERKNIVFEGIAVRDGFWVRGVHSNLDVIHYENIINFNKVDPAIFGNKDCRVSSAWWYCAFPISLAEKQGLPMPFFLRSDDVEWSWRACSPDTHFISMNGISIWHANFEWRVSKVSDYFFVPRNMFFTQAIHTPNSKEQNITWLKHRVRYIVETYDYTSMEILERALRDILDGCKSLRHNPEQLFQSLNEICKKVEWKDCSEEELQVAINYDYYAKQKRWRRRVYNLTNKGRFAPNFLRKRQAHILDWYPHPDAFKMTRSVCLYNLATKKMTVRKYDRHQVKAYKKRLSSLVQQIDNRYDELKDTFLNLHRELSTVDFWKQYLNLA